MSERLVGFQKLTFALSLAIGASSLAACGDIANTSDTPNKGIVTSTNERTVTGGCVVSVDGVCYLYDQYQQYDVTVATCQMQEGKIVLADDKYLANHIKAPSDFAMVGTGVSAPDKNHADGVDCGTTYDVSQDEFSHAVVGQLFTSN